MWVTPVVALVPPPVCEASDAAAASAAWHAKLCADEVEHLFSVPLRRFLSAQGHRSQQYAWSGAPSGKVTLHFFDDPNGMVWGLTAAVLIRLAEVAFNTPAEFAVGDHISSGLTMFSRHIEEQEESERKASRGEGGGGGARARL